MKNNFFRSIKQDICDGNICCISGCELKAENVKCILDSDDFFIKLLMPENKISIFGSDLVIVEKRESSVYITGKIDNIEFEGRTL